MIDFPTLAAAVETLNFDYYLPSHPADLEAFYPEPTRLHPELYSQMTGAARVLNNLVNRLLRDYLADPALHGAFSLPEFPFRESVLSLKRPLVPFFWARYDAFIREQGGIFFSEFNYDKPCAQREMMASEQLGGGGQNPCSGFADSFRNALIQIWDKHGDNVSPPTVGILIDPAHIEESHLALLYADLIKPLGWETFSVGGRNLEIDSQGVKAFGRYLDLIIRQFPIEFGQEINDFSGLLKLYDNYKVLILNDPRAIVPQSKGMFAYLWRLVEDDSSYLTPVETQIITSTIPYTRILRLEDQDELLSNRDQWVIKASYGRYSEEVYIGTMHSPTEWEEVVRYVLESAKEHVMQEFIPIKETVAERFAWGGPVQTSAFCNYGVYFTSDEITGVCARWSPDYLSEDDSGWFTPIILSSDPVPELYARFYQVGSSEQRLANAEVISRQLEEMGFPLEQPDDIQAFTVDPFILNRGFYQEIRDTTDRMACLLNRAAQLARQNLDLFGPLLGIPEILYDLIHRDQSPWLTCFGRFDWGVDVTGRPWLFEINSDTPGGLEAIQLNKIASAVYDGFLDPNQEFPTLLRTGFFDAIGHPKASSTVVGLITSMDSQEDIFNLHQFASHIEVPGLKFIMGDISDLKAAEKLLLNNRVIDVLYRYYPLDWMAERADALELLDSLATIQFINPASALIPQSKAFLAMVHQLVREGFYSMEESQFITDHIPVTQLVWPNRPCVIKPYFEREGTGVCFSEWLSKEELNDLADEEVVYQDPVEIRPFVTAVRSSRGLERVSGYPVLGSFLINDRFAGIYTRIGGAVTDPLAVVCATLVEK
ncbi:MAG: glutathionylspermidine synthase family protein [Candidatus Saccharibacteria bacterium]